jgi:glycosyltransferase involved in cell wall biosynthesis
MQIGHLSTLTAWGGVERMLVDLLEHSVALPGHIHHHLITTSSRSDILAAVQQAGISHMQPQRRSRYDLSAVQQMVGWIRQHDIQVLHSYNAYANIWAMVLHQLAGAPRYVAGEHGTVNSAKFPVALLDAFAYRRASAITASSQAIALELQRRYRIPSEHIRVVYNAIAPLPRANNAMLRQKLGLPNGPLVGSVGRLSAVKDFATLIHAAAHVLRERPDVTFVLVGGGPHETALRERAQRLGIAERFRLTGWRSDARQIVQLFDLFVSTSLSESFGNVLVEAALAGKPVIAPAVGGIPEAVVDGETGDLLLPTRPVAPLLPNDPNPAPQFTRIAGQRVPVRSLDPKLLADAILHLLSDPVRAERYGRAGQARAIQRFGMERYREELEQIYRSLV